MKLFYSTLILFTITLVSISCKKENDESFGWEDFDDLPSDTYYDTDPIDPAFADVYGTWWVYSTSGGLAGTGYEVDFEKLLVKKNGIFGIVKNDSLLAYGKVYVQSQTASELLVRFEPEEEVLGINLITDNEKYVSFRGSDSLDLTAPCCDRFNTHLKRQ